MYHDPHEQDATQAQFLSGVLTGLNSLDSYHNQKYWLYLYKMFTTSAKI